MSHLIDGELVTPCSTTIVAQHFQSICEAVAKLESKLLDQFDVQNKSKRCNGSIKHGSISIMEASTSFSIQATIVVYCGVC